MIRVGAQTSVSAVDVRTLAAVLPALARCWRGLRFEQGVCVPAAGQRREGLRVEQGTHPRPGTRYLLVFDPGGWPAGGPFAIEAGLALDQLPPAQGSVPQLVAEARHRRAQGRAEVAIKDADAGSWTVDVAIQARGRGLARPIAAVLAPFAQRYAQRGLDALIGRHPDEVDQFNRQLREEFGRAPDPEQMADKVPNDLLADVAEHVS